MNERKVKTKAITMYLKWGTSGFWWPSFISIHLTTVTFLDESLELGRLFSFQTKRSWIRPQSLFKCESPGYMFCFCLRLWLVSLRALVCCQVERWSSFITWALRFVPEGSQFSQQNIFLSWPETLVQPCSVTQCIYRLNTGDWRHSFSE